MSLQVKGEELFNINSLLKKASEIYKDLLPPKKEDCCDTETKTPNVDPKTCIKELFGEIKNEVPTYWAQRMLRPKDVRLYLTQKEIESSAIFSTLDTGYIDYSHQDFTCLTQNKPNYPKGTIDSHGACTLALLCSKNQCSISPANNVTHIYTHRWEHVKYNDYLLNGIKKVINRNKAIDNPQNKIKVISISMDDFDSYTEDIKTLLSQIDKKNEVNIVWSAGNELGKKEKSTLGHYSNILLTSNISRTRYSLVITSNYGLSTSISAPSDYFIKAIRRKPFGGTSGAAPLVAGTLLTINKVNPNLDATTARAILKACAQDLGSPGKDKLFGYGMPNIPLSAAIARIIKKEDIEKIKKESPHNQFETNLLKHIRKLIQNGEYINSVPKPPLCVEVSYKKEEYDYKSIKNSKNCKEYACRFDHLMNQYFLSNMHPMYTHDICKMYKDLNLDWGIVNYCPPQYSWKIFIDHFKLTGKLHPLLRYLGMARQMALYAKDHNIDLKDNLSFAKRLFVYHYFLTHYKMKYETDKSLQVSVLMELLEDSNSYIRSKALNNLLKLKQFNNIIIMEIMEILVNRYPPNTLYTLDQLLKLDLEILHHPSIDQKLFHTLKKRLSTMSQSPFFPLTRRRAKMVLDRINTKK